MEELLDLRLRLQRARERRDAQPAHTDAWLAASAEVDAALLLVWHHRPVSSDLAASR